VKKPVESTSKRPTQQPVQAGDEAAMQAALLAERDRLLAENAALIAELNGASLLNEKLKLQIARMKRLAFGSTSEKDKALLAQLELALDDLETSEGQSEAAPVPVTPIEGPVSEQGPEPKGKPARRPLPEHLPRESVEHAPDLAHNADGACGCPSCGKQMRQMGEDVTEVLEYVPESWKVIRHVRPKFSCRVCDTIVQAPATGLLARRLRHGPNLLAHVVVAKYANHLPLYRQSDIYARSGIDIDRSSLTDDVGHVAKILTPLIDLLAKDVMTSPVLHGDDTPVSVLAPGAGKTKTGRLWAYVRDERGHGGERPPAAVYYYSPDRKGEHPVGHLASFAGHLHADGYAGFNPLYAPAKSNEPAKVQEVACMAHVRRKFFDIHAATASPIAGEAIKQIAALYGVEAEARGHPPDQRKAIRQAKASPLMAAFQAWLEQQLTRIPKGGDLAVAIRYALTRFTALSRYLEDGTLEIDNNIAERAIRGLAVGRKNWLFAGSDTGGQRAAAIYSLIETAKLNAIDPEAWLADILPRIDDHPNKRLHELLPWNWKPATVGTTV
jgi:transposase